MTVMKTRSWTEPVRSRRNDRNASCVSNRRKGRRKTLSRWWVWCGLLEFCCNFRQFKWNVLTKWCSSNVLNAWFVILKYEVHSASTSAVTLGHVIIVCHCHVGMCGIVILFRFGFGLVFEKKTWIRLGMSLVQFGLRNSDLVIVVIYYLCNTWVVYLQRILQRYCAVLNELCIPDFDAVVNKLWCYSQQRQIINVLKSIC